MNLRSVNEILPNTKIILRMDLDLPISEGKILDNSRLIKSVPTIKLLLEKQCKMIIIGHRGRPNGKDETLSLKPVYLELMTLLEPNGENMIESVFIENVEDMKSIDLAAAANNIVFLENLRFWPGEANNDSSFLQGLTEICQFFVNDAFTVSHRKSASVMLYKKLPGFYGIDFIEEVEKMDRVFNNPARPLTVILGGAKEDKLDYLAELAEKADYVLIGGKLPKLINSEQQIVNSQKIIIAKLRKDGLDLDEEDINKFREKILQSKTIVWVGAMGMYEDQNCKKGTEEVAKAVAEASAYKIIAGGDTNASVVSLGLKEKINFVCSGGGVLLEYLIKGTLPAWE